MHAAPGNTTESQLRRTQRDGSCQSSGERFQALARVGPCGRQLTKEQTFAVVITLHWHPGAVQLHWCSWAPFAGAASIAAWARKGGDMALEVGRGEVVPGLVETERTVMAGMT
jgi:hypothetical protein